jgi:hypothetical protein
MPLSADDQSVHAINHHTVGNAASDYEDWQERRRRPVALNLGIPEVGRPLSDQGRQRRQILHLLFFDAGFVLIKF